MDHNTDIIVAKEKPTMQMQENEIVLYQPNEAIHLEVRIEEDTVWLNRNQMAILFGRDVKTIGKHVNNTLREELQGMATVAKFAIVQNEGGRTDLHTQHHTTTRPRPAAPQCAIPPHRHRCVPKRPRPLPLHRRHGVSYRRLAEGLGQEMVCF